jgi:hypothetical protein
MYSATQIIDDQKTCAQNSSTDSDNSSTSKGSLATQSDLTIHKYPIEKKKFALMLDHFTCDANTFSGIFFRRFSQTLN